MLGGFSVATKPMKSDATGSVLYSADQETLYLPMKVGNTGYPVASLTSVQFAFSYFLLSPTEEFRCISYVETLTMAGVIAAMIFYGHLLHARHAARL